MCQFNDCYRWIFADIFSTILRKNYLNIFRILFWINPTDSFFCFTESYNDLRSVALSHHAPSPTYNYATPTHPRLSPYSTQSAQYYDSIIQHSSPSPPAESPTSPHIVNNNNNNINNGSKVIINGESIDRPTVVSLSS